MAQRLQKELEEERALNKSLLTNETTWRTRTEQAETEAKTAREECRELLLNLELRSKLEELASTDQVYLLFSSNIFMVHIDHSILECLNLDIASQ